MRLSVLHIATFAVLGIALLAALHGVSATGTAAGNETTVSLYVGEDTEFGSVSDVETALRDETLEPDDYLIVNQTLVVELDSERLAEDLEQRNGTTSQRFFAALDDGMNFSLVQTNPTPQRQPMQIPVGPDNTTVYRNGTTTYVSIDTSAVEPVWFGGDAIPDAEIRGGAKFAVRFGYGLDEDEYTYIEPEIGFQYIEAEPWGPYSTEWPEVLAPELVNMSVDVNVEPDERMLLRLELEDGPTLTKEPEEVPWSGFVGASFDLRDVAPGTNYTLGLIHDGKLVGPQNGTVRALDATLQDASVTLADTANVSDSAEYEAEISLAVNLSHGGQIQVFDDRGRDIGFKWVDPGETEISIRVPDSQYPGEFAPDELTVRAVRRSGSDIDQYPGDEAEITLDVSGYDWGTTTETPTETSTSTATSTDVETPKGTASSTETETQTLTDEEPADGDGPGFTAVAVVGALLTLLAVSSYRRDCER